MKHTTPKHVFLHLLMIIMLTVSVIATLTILFQYINHAFFDAAMYMSQSALFSSIRWGSSILIVSLPVLLYCNHSIHKEIIKSNEVRDMKTRRWLLYLTQFVTAMTIIIDLMVLLYHFYGGELTTRFVLKVVSVLIVAAIVLGYYRWEIMWNGAASKVPKYTAITVGALAIITIVSGFVIVGTPNYQRKVRFDEKRVDALNQLQYDIINYIDSNSQLPTAEEITRWRGSMPTDPDTNMPYQYEKTGENMFKLCAIFATENKQEKVDTYAYPEFRGITPKGQIIGENTWYHPAGNYCFEREVSLMDSGQIDKK